MPTITRLTSTGTLMVNGTFDEITTSTIRFTTDTVYTQLLDEVSLSAGSFGFDGVNQYLTVSDNPAFQFGTGDFTIECWCYPTFDVTSGSAAASLWSFNGSNYIQCTWDNIYKSWNFANTTNGYTVRPTGGVPENDWTHVAYVRSGTSGRAYYNGIQVGSTATDSQNYTASGGNSIIGFRTVYAEYMKGYIADLRVTKGQALYTGNFIPPQLILDATTSTSLLLNILNNADFLKDNSPNNFTVTNNNGVTFVSTGSYNRSNFSVMQRQLSTGVLEIKGVFDEYEFTRNVIFTTPGTSSWTVPSGVTSVTVSLWGAGGGSGGNGYTSGGGGGGGGAYASKVLSVTPGQSISYTVGTGGGAGGYVGFPIFGQSVGTTGGASTCSSVTAGGGLGGGDGVGGAGGSASGGDVNISGQSGFYGGSPFNDDGGLAGNSPNATANSTVSPFNGLQPGGGQGGGGTDFTGKGGDGQVKFEW